MTNKREGETNGEVAGCSGSRISVHPERELEANWEVDLGKKLEEYLLKICSGQITVSEDLPHIPVNFAEAALLLQGSVQVYSRKVEYLYNLVLHTLEFLSQNRQQDQSEGTSVAPEESGSQVVGSEENDVFWGFDDIPVEQNTCLVSPTGKDTLLNLVKPPANLVVLEGDCLDTTGDGTELESYLLATNELYRDFILLDPWDAPAVDAFLEGDEIGKGQSAARRGSTGHKSFLSPMRRSGGTAQKSSHRKNKDVNLDSTPRPDGSVKINDFCMEADAPGYDNFEDNNCGLDMDDRCSEPDDSNDDDDPWKPLNPHEPGNLKMKPFKKVKSSRRKLVNSIKCVSITTHFPLAKLHGTVSPELAEIWETRHNASVGQKTSHSPPLYEKLRQSLLHEGQDDCDVFGNSDGYNEENGYDSENPDIGQPDADMPDGAYMEEDAPFYHDKDGDAAPPFETNDMYEHGGQNSQASLEDLCRSHLDALLASIAETEKQTELAARVSSWKQKIEHNLDEQDSRRPFDIHLYGENILQKLSLEGSSENALSFTEVVNGQEKHDVARTFSALLQLVNNGDVDLDRGGVDNESVCFSALNPFYVRRLGHEKNQGQMQFKLPSKRAKSPILKKGNKSIREKSPTADSSFSGHRASVTSLEPNCKFSMKLGKMGGRRCTPESKRRRRSRLVEPVDSHSSG